MNGLRFSIALLLLMAAGGRAWADFSFTVPLTGSQERPPVVTPAMGTATISYVSATGVLSYSVNFTGLTAPLTAGHIHVVPLGQTSETANGPVVLNFFPTTGVTSLAFTGQVTSAGGASQSSGGPPTFNFAALPDVTNFASFITAIEQRRAYFNFHTSANPGGEIRANIVPEPSTIALSGLGLAVVLALAWRRPDSAA
jgi:hypothetical protein